MRLGRVFFSLLLILMWKIMNALIMKKKPPDWPSLEPELCDIQAAFSAASFIKWGGEGGAPHPPWVIMILMDNLLTISN